MKWQGREQSTNIEIAPPSMDKTGPYQSTYDQAFNRIHDKTRKERPEENRKLNNGDNNDAGGGVVF